jgi:S-adenosylmethionine-diacylglycerol 3-amino-3-carboxypropyl transferase
MNTVKKIIHRINNRFLGSVAHNRLVYNTCWEDPAIDRKLLQLDPESHIVMLSSAGCNALDYLLDEPARIDCVDINPAQNAVLNLKKALFYNGNYSMLWTTFGLGQNSAITPQYYKHLRDFLKKPGQAFWDDHLDYFSPFSNAGSFYFRGTTGNLAQIIYKKLQHHGVAQHVKSLLSAKLMAEQRYYFEEIEPHLWTSFSRWVVNKNATMAMLGVPEGQRHMIDNDMPGGLPAYIHQSVKQVFTEQPVADNYFWRVYLTGAYTKNCCPNYLKESNFKAIKNKVDNLQLHNNSLINFLEHHPKNYSHFVLLDHQDWQVAHHPEKIAQTWRLMLKNARPGARILFRSAGRTRYFLPEFIYEHVHFEDKQTQELHATDRVGTYGSTHLAVVDTPL